MSISEAMYNEGLDIGYSRIGASKLTTLESESIIDELKLEYPWAKSIIIGVWHYNFYKIPDGLKDVSKEDIFEGRYLKGSHENEVAMDMEAFFTQNKLQYVDIMSLDKNVKNKIAEKMEIGLIRKNGYFYTEEGSFCTLHAWLIDKAIEWRHAEAPAACLGHCSICIRSCPEKALEEGLKDPIKCISLNSKIINVTNQDINTACDHCQDVCPFNKDRWTEEEVFLR